MVKKYKDLYFTDFIRLYIKKLLNTDKNIRFYWDRLQEQKEPYIVYQTEDLDINGKLSEEYLSFLNAAEKVYEYSEPNFKYYQKSEFKPFLPNIKKYSADDSQPKEIEVLFYGLCTKRRKEIINSIKKDYDVVIKDNLSLLEMTKLIKNSKWVLSIGSETNIHNDMIRVAPALNMGASIMLEYTQEHWYNEFLQKNFAERIKFI